MGLGLSFTRNKLTDNRLGATGIIPYVQPSKCVLWRQGGFQSVDLARRNWADATKLSAIGAPVAGDYAVTYKAQSNYLRTNIFETPFFTAFFYAKSDGAANGVMMSSFRGAADAGMLIYWVSATQLRVQAYQGAMSARSALLTVTNPAVFKRYSVVCTDALIKVWNETDGTTAEATITAARYVGQLPIQLGSAPSVSFTGNSASHLEALFNNVAFTDAERSKFWAQAIPIAQACGVVENAA